MFQLSGSTVRSAAFQTESQRYQEHRQFSLQARCVVEADFGGSKGHACTYVHRFTCMYICLFTYIYIYGPPTRPTACKCSILGSRNQVRIKFDSESRLIRDCIQDQSSKIRGKLFPKSWIQKPSPNSQILANTRSPKGTRIPKSLGCSIAPKGRLNSHVLWNTGGPKGTLIARIFRYSIAPKAFLIHGSWR